MQHVIYVHMVKSITKKILWTQEKTSSFWTPKQQVYFGLFNIIFILTLQVQVYYRFPSAVIYKFMLSNISAIKEMKTWNVIVQLWLTVGSHVAYPIILFHEQLGMAAKGKECLNKLYVTKTPDNGKC